MLYPSVLIMQEHPRRLQRRQPHMEAAMPAVRRGEVMLAPWTVKSHECSEGNYVVGGVHVHPCYSVLLI